MKHLLVIISLLAITQSSLGQNGFRQVPTVKGIIFRVQLAFSKQLLKPSDFKGLDGIMVNRSAKGTYRYIIGSFYYYEAANAMKVEMVEAGYKDANVIAYQDGERILVEDAMESVGATFVDEQPAIAQEEEKKIKPKALNKDGKLTFTVQVSSRKNKAPEDHPMREKVPELNERQEEDGLFHYYSGLFSNMSDARDRRIALKSQGYEFAFIISYLDGVRIPLRDAVSILAARGR
jgi:hypothetical protein